MVTWLVNTVQAESLRLEIRIQEAIPHALICPAILHGAEVALHIAYAQCRHQCVKPLFLALSLAMHKKRIQNPRAFILFRPGSSRIDKTVV